jgi:glycosyltransferase involved in cell wall biosynthesis
MLRLPWSASAHAKDIWTTPDWEKAEKLQDADWVVTCTKAGADHLNALSPRRPVERVHHGIDTGRFPAAAPRPVLETVTILSVGRAVAKKGFDDLLNALALLPRDLPWRFVHIGGGPLLADLKAQATRLSIADRIDWRGSRPEAEVRDAYRKADMFVLASRVTADGDRDGIPNVVAEAMSQGLPVVATTAGAIPELVTAATGLLVNSGDTAALADAMTALIANPQRRAALGHAAAQHIASTFQAEHGYDRIAALLTQAPALRLAAE